MAYLAFAEAGVGGLGEAVVPRVGQAASPRADAPVAATVTGLSALEWAVVALARNDRKGSLRTPGRMAMALGTLFGERPNPRLADPRLEALRRIAVLSWHHGYTVPSHEVRAFLAAGFTPAQYELMVDSIGVDRREGQQERLRA